MQFDTLTVQNWTPWLSEFGNTHGVRDQSRLKYIMVLNMEAVDWEGGMMGAETLIIG